jgi:hypothetical protein
MPSCDHHHHHHQYHYKDVIDNNNMPSLSMPSMPSMALPLNRHHKIHNVLSPVMKLETKQSYESLNILQKTKVLDHLYVEWKDYIGTRDIKRGNKSRPYFKSYFISKKLSERYPGLGHRVFRLAMNLRLSNEKEKGAEYKRKELDVVLTKKDEELNVMEQLAPSVTTTNGSDDDTAGDSHTEGCAYAGTNDSEEDSATEDSADDDTAADDLVIPHMQGVVIEGKQMFLSSITVERKKLNQCLTVVTETKINNNNNSSRQGKSGDLDEVILVVNSI